MVLSSAQEMGIDSSEDRLQSDDIGRTSDASKIIFHFLNLDFTVTSADISWQCFFLSLPNICHENIEPTECVFRSVQESLNYRLSWVSGFVRRGLSLSSFHCQSRLGSSARVSCTHIRLLVILSFQHMAVCQNLVPLVNIKIAGKWMFIPLKWY